MRIFKLALFATPLFLLACQPPEEPTPEPSAEAAIESIEPIESIESIELPAAPRYGFTEENPILVGAEVVDGGPARERVYLDSLTGPDGQPLSYARRGSCCPFETPKSPFGGLLDVYEVMYEGLDEPILLYLNMYDPGETHAPEGFKVQS